MTAKLAFVFPGQGSQHTGMLDSFIADSPTIVADVCAQASDVLGYDMLQLIAHNPDEKLNQTVYTQPALLTAGVVAWQIWQDQCDQQPELLAGHSLGEYTALVCAQALSFADGLRLVAKRGELMQNAVAPGAGSMAALIGLELSQVIEICANVDASPANINAPGQIVVAGTTDAVNIVIEKAKAIGAKRAIVLPVSVPSHCKLMEPAAVALRQEMLSIKWQQPKIAVIHNYDVQPHKDAAGICEVLDKQLYSPVRWIETIEYFAQHGVTEILECGPGKVLTGLNKRIVPTVNCKAMVESLGIGLC